MSPRTLACLVLAGAAGCSFVFDGGEPDLPLLGAPDRSAQVKLNRGPAGRASVILGRDRAYWVTFTETFIRAEGPKRGYRVVRLDPPAAEEELVGENILLTYRAFWRTERRGEGDAARTLLAIHSAGEGDHWDEFDLPAGPATLLIGGADDIFVYWPRDPKVTEFLLSRRDRSYARMIPVPPGVDSADPYAKGEFAFTYDGKWFITRDAEGHMLLYSTSSDEIRDFGVVEGALSLGNFDIFACAPTGLTAVALADGAPRVLDGERCDGEGYAFRGPWIYYRAAGETRRTRLDGTGAPEQVLPAGRRMLGFGPGEEVLHTRLPPFTYVNDASDGWLGEWRFMERGRAAQYSPRTERLRWLERAAQSSQVGDLYSAPVTGGEPLRLARNVRRYSELADGRLLVQDNRAYRGVHNRIIVVDEERREARWVAEAAGDWANLPGGDEILVFSITGPESYDILRTPIPPR